MGLDSDFQPNNKSKTIRIDLLPERVRRSHPYTFFLPQAVGACWYLLGIQRAAKCLKEQCLLTTGCGPKTVACVNPIYYGTTTSIREGGRLAWAKNLQARAMCLDSSDNFQYGAYQWTVPLVTNTSRLEKILLPIFWGLMTLRYAFSISLNLILDVSIPLALSN